MKKSHNINPRLKKPGNQVGKEWQSVEQLSDAIRNGNRYALSRGITLVESKNTKDKKDAGLLFDNCFADRRFVKRIGISGSPGVGKSSLIEQLGRHLIQQDYSPAILAIDPSSSISKGSILGDKTRMGKLAKSSEAYIRPSPASGFQGGTAEHSYEASILCETAGFDPIIIETIGVGQSEIRIRSMVDFFILLILPGSGDEIQGIKKGIMEMADLIVIHKADGDRLSLATQSMKDYKVVLNLIRSYNEHWLPKVLLASSLEGTGIEQIWDQVTNFYKKNMQHNFISALRTKQQVTRFHEILSDFANQFVLSNERIQSELSHLEEELKKGMLSANEASQLMEISIKNEFIRKNL